MEEDITDQQLQWDLRATYVGFITKRWGDIYEAEKERDYVKLLENIEDMWPEVLSRVKKKFKKTRDKYQDLLTELLKTINKSEKHKAVFLRRSSDPLTTSEVRAAFHRIKFFILRVMEKNGHFGTKPYYQGL